MLMHFHIVFGCVLTTLAELSRYKRDCTSPKPKILTVCPSKKKFADPCPKQDCSMKVISTFGPDDSLLWRGILCIVECSGAFLVSSYYNRCLQQLSALVKIKKCVQTLPNVSWGQNFYLSRTTALRSIPLQKVSINCVLKFFGNSSFLCGHVIKPIHTQIHLVSFAFESQLCFKILFVL